jgi:hypothetical protein
MWSGLLDSSCSLGAEAIADRLRYSWPLHFSLQAGDNLPCNLDSVSLFHEAALLRTISGELLIEF